MKDRVVDLEVKEKENLKIFEGFQKKTPQIFLPIYTLKDNVITMIMPCLNQGVVMSPSIQIVPLH